MWFFHKSVYVIDLLDNLIDIHNHLLPSIDDGAKDVDICKKMIAKMRDCNISRAIATPHVMQDFYNLDEETIKNSFHKTMTELSSEDRYFLMDCAAEYMIDHEFIEKSCHRNLLLINDKYALTEFSYFQKPNFVEEVAFNLKTIDVIPILAHPERYRYLHKFKEYTKLKDSGFLFQLNLLSLSGQYGKQSQENSLKLLNQNLYDFVGTDAHKEKDLESLRTLKLMNKHVEGFKNLIVNHKRNTSNY